MLSRRNFLKALLGIGALALLPNSFGLFREIKHLARPDTYDILVVGGGPAGVAAALTAAREGRQVALVEQSAYLGGMGTLALVSNFTETNSAHGIFTREILNNIGMTFDPRKYDALLKYKVDEELSLHLFLETAAADVIVQDGRVAGIRAVGGGTAFDLPAKVVVDATGNGDIFARAGALWSTGRESKDRFGEVILGLDQPDNNVQGHTYCCIIEEKTGSNHLLPRPADYDPKEFARFIFADDTPSWNPETDYFWQIAWYPVDFGDWKKRYIINHTHTYGNPSRLDAKGKQALADKARNRLHRLVYHIQTAMGKRNWGPVDIFGAPLGFAQTLGIRESRRLHGEYIIDENHLLAGRKTSDTIALVDHLPDIHVCTRAEEQDMARTKGYGYTWPPEICRSFARHGGNYGIPYRSLLPLGVEGLIVAGRCISGTHIAQSSFRMQPFCYCQGEAAGMAASLAVENGTGLHGVNPAHLQKKLLANYALLFRFSDLKTIDKDYPAAALAALYGALPVDSEAKADLDRTVTKAELVKGLHSAAQAGVAWTNPGSGPAAPTGTPVMGSPDAIAGIGGAGSGANGLTGISTVGSGANGPAGIGSVGSTANDPTGIGSIGSGANGPAGIGSAGSSAPATRLDLAVAAARIFQLNPWTAGPLNDVPDLKEAALVRAFMYRQPLDPADYARTIHSGHFRPNEPITRRTLAWAVFGLLAPYVPLPHWHEKGILETIWVTLWGTQSYKRLLKIGRFG